MNSETPRKNEPTTGTERKTDKKTDHTKSPSNWWDRAKPWVELGGVILLAIYTGFTIAMYFANKKSADAAKQAAKTAQEALIDSQASFKLQNRPYVIVPGTATFVVDKKGHIDKTRANVAYRNVGKTPGQDVVLTSYFTVVRINIEKPTWEEWVGIFEEAFKPVIERKGEVFRSGAPAQNMDVAPDAPASFSSQELNGNLSKTDELKLRETGRVMLVFSGRLYYKGFERKESYTTDFCFWYFGLDPQTWHYCPVHNTLN
jgi:hypothetical protein